MTQTLSFNFLPHRREFLEIGIGSKLRQDFAYNSYTPLPKVSLFSQEEARAAGYPGGGLGWFNFKTTEIGILVFNNQPASIAWQMATGVAVHEHLHWLWSLSPATVGCQNEPERFIMNVFTDAANEQRAMLESSWSRKFLRRTRQILLPKAWAEDSRDPLYQAGLMSLAVHTLLSVKGHRIMRKLHESKQPETMARDLWNLCEKSFNRQLPAEQMELWLKAFSLCLRAWTAESDFTRFALALELIDLYPKPSEPLPDSPLEMGGHLGAECDRPDNPAGITKSGFPIGENQRISAPLEKPAAETSVQEESAKTVEKPVEDEASKNEESKSGEPDEILSFDESSPTDLEEKAELEKLEIEALELNRLSEPMPGATVTNSPIDQIHPGDPRGLITETQIEAAALAERLRIVARPRLRSQDSKGKVVSRIVAHDPAAAKPFRSRSVAVKAFGPQVFVALILDTSGSMRSGSKAVAAKRAAMTIHLACAQENVRHLIVTSRNLQCLAGGKITADKSRTFIAGLIPNSGGDNYIQNLPQVIELVRKRQEAVRILLVLTDGMPGSAPDIKKMIDIARKSGVILIGIGLDLVHKEKEAMKDIFGAGSDHTVLAQSMGFARVMAEVLSNAVTRGTRQSISSW